MRQILHVDMDAFYASVEQRDNPALVGKPLVVGGPSRRGVVAAASYEARRYGIRSAMSMGEALRRHPGLVVVFPRMGRYAEVSAHVFSIFRRFSPLVEGLSLDEGFIDVTRSRNLFGDGEAIAVRIRAAIREELGLTASAGVAPSKFVAKIASDLKKPDGLVVVAEGTEETFLADLPIERMWGLGPKTAPKLHALGYRTFRDLACAGPDRLEQALGSWGRTVAELARGVDSREVEASREAKSMGHEQTYETDIVRWDDLERCVLAHCERVAQRLVRDGLEARVVAVKLKHADFTLRTRQGASRVPVRDTMTLFDSAGALLRRFPSFERAAETRGRLPVPIRLVGVSVADLQPAEARPALFPDPVSDKRHRVEAVMARVKSRFGDARLTRATLLDDPEGDS